MKKIKPSIFILIALLFCLVGCDSTTKQAVEQATKKYTKRSKFVYGERCHLKTQDALVKNLKDQGVYVIYWGDRIILNTPTEKLFNGRSLMFAEGATAILNNIAKLLLCYQKIAVKVTAYTDLLADKKSNQSFSGLQAEKITTYLSRRGIDSGFVFAVAGGRAKSAQRAGGSRRIEIATQKMP